MRHAAPAWDAAASLTGCPVTSWQSQAWRFHKRRYAADDPTGSLRLPGRFHSGWPTLYLSLRSHIAPGEVLRHLIPQDVPLLRDGYRLTEFWLELQAVLICCELPACAQSIVAHMPTEDLCRDDDFAEVSPAPTQQLGAAAMAMGVEAMIVPSCTGYTGGNLVLFPQQLQSGSIVRIVRAEDPSLFVERAAPGR